MDKILALDQSSRITGWAIFDNNQFKECGVFETTNSDLGVRLEKLRNFVQNKIKDENITLTLIENIQLQEGMNNNVQTFKALSEVFGVLEELLTEMEIPYEVIHSGTWKSTLGIKGKNRPEQKKAAANYVKAHYGITPTQDEADAICIGAHYIETHNPNNWD